MKQVRGLTLIELMIASAIGLIIITLAISFLTTNLKTRNVNAAYATLKDNGSISMYFLARYIREAGLETIPINGDANITGGNCNPDAAWCTSNSDNQSDRLAVRKIFPDDTIACNGETAKKAEEIVEVFSLIRQPNYSYLACQTYSLTNNAWLGSNRIRILQTGIDDFQVKFFETGSAFAKRAQNVSNWDNVQGLEVGVIANSEIPAHLQPLKQNFDYLHARRTYNDRYARQIFQTTIALNNQLLEEDTP